MQQRLYQPMMTDVSAQVNETLERDGVAVLPHTIDPALLTSLQHAFQERLTARRWNTTDGFEQNECVQPNSIV